MDKRIFCEKPVADGQQMITLTAKGCDGIERGRKERGGYIHVVPSQVMHIRCRSEYVSARAIKRDKRKHSVDPSEVDTAQCSLRSSEAAFSYKDNCLFCGYPDIYEGRGVEYKLVLVRTLGFQEKIIKACKEFRGDWVD